MPVVGIPSLDLVAWPLRHSSRTVVAVLDARRREVFHARYRPVPGGFERIGRLRGRDARRASSSTCRPPATTCSWPATASTPIVRCFAELEHAELAGAEFVVTVGRRAGRSRHPADRARGVRAAVGAVRPLYLRASDAEIDWERCGRVRVTAWDGVITEALTVHVHADAASPRTVGAAHRGAGLSRARGACRCSCRSSRLRTTRAYFVARVGRDVVGYAGLMMTAEDGHVTTIAVDPKWHRHKIGTRLLLALAREAIARDAENLTLEVRLSNKGAQDLYRRVRLLAGRSAQGLLPGDERGRARHVGPRGQHPELRRAAGRLESRIPGETHLRGTPSMVTAR